MLDFVSDLEYYHWLGLAAALVFVLLLRRRQPKTAAAPDSAERQLTGSKQASRLIGARVTLTQTLRPETDKIEVQGRFWKVKANRDFPADTVVEVVGHFGDTLEIASAENLSYKTDHAIGEGSTPLADYRRDGYVLARSLFAGSPQRQAEEPDRAAMGRLNASA